MTTRTTPVKPRIIVSGILFWYPLAGVTYQFLHYLLGLRRLGYEPYYIEDSTRWIYDPDLNEPSPDPTRNIARVAPILERFGLGDRWAYRSHGPAGRCFGMTEEAILRLYREADAFLNVTAAQEIREEHLWCPRRIYVESDPFAVQVKVAQGDAATLAALEVHDTLFSFGENLGAPDCGAPAGRFTWLPTRQPVVVDLWSDDAPEGGPTYTTITTWRNKTKDVVYRGRTYYWRKDREFRRFIDLPQRSSARFELATETERPTRALLRKHGWEHRAALEVSSDLDRYRGYIQDSRGEFTVARDQYVRPRTGWFSDRSACYLAAGRPVITQETGFSKFLPTGKGLFGFTTMDDILSAVAAIESDYVGHCRAAREIASEYFGAERVLDSLLTRAGLQS
jgi:hypothetical protein